MVRPQHHTNTNSRRLPQHHQYEFQIRRFPIFLALSVLVGIPVYISFTGLQTTLTEAELRLKIVDSEGTAPVAYNQPGSFRGTGWINPERTVDKVILAETPFARCEAHSVMSEDGQGHLIKDWLWMEEAEHVNVAVLDSNRNFIVMKQKKYGLPSESLATVGGFIEEGESPFEAAMREVAEELGMGTRATKERLDKSRKRDANAPLGVALGLSGGDPLGSVSEEERADWIFLGKYRTSTNRGGGFVYDYFLKEAIPIEKDGGTSKFKASGEGEHQNIFQISIDDTRKAVLNGEFQELAWTNAMGLSLVQIMSGALNK